MHPADPRVAAPAVTVAVVLAALVALLARPLAPAAGAAPRLHPPAEASASSGGEEARIRAYWTPERMRSTPPLLASGRTDPLAVASFAPVPDATLPPFLVNGRIFVRQGRSKGYCSGTAINSPSRRLVLTAGHCVNSGPRGRRGSSAWSRYMEFVPAYTDGAAPFGSFVARRSERLRAQAVGQGRQPQLRHGRDPRRPEHERRQRRRRGRRRRHDRAQPDPQTELPDLRLPRQSAPPAAAATRPRPAKTGSPARSPARRP